VVSVRAENVVLKTGVKPALPPGDYVRVSIADQGAGIAKEMLPKIFDPYFSTKERGDKKGMGLGLTICHSIIQKHEGAITVKSEAGTGATFQILLPACRKLPVSPEKTASGPAIPQRPAKLLVMDDEEAVRNVVGTILQQMGHAVELVADGAQAIKAYQDAQRQGTPFDLVLLDLTVQTGLGGQETLRALLHSNLDVRAIVMTGYSNDPVLLEPERHGFKGGLAKPFSGDQLQKMLARILPNRPAP
jgi:CheY-like chemotaxis protein